MLGSLIQFHFQLLANAPVTHAHDVASRKMHQAGVLAFAEEVEQVKRGIDVRGKGVAQIRVKVRQSRAIDD